ncbi:ABC-three component system protein [Thermodesulfobacteriota bacterium]
MLDLKDLNRNLGHLMFDLPTEPPNGKFNPRFRGLTSYFVRKGRDAYMTPFEHFRKQRKAISQVDTAFLLGLGWDYVRQQFELEGEKNELNAFKKAIRSDLMNNMFGSLGKLQATKVQLQEEVDRQRNQLDSFKVHPQYREIQDEADVLTNRIKALNDANVKDDRLRRYYEDTFKDEEPAQADAVIRLYREIGLTLPRKVAKRLKDVESFHARVVENRRDFLQNEIEKLSLAVEERESEVKRLSEERAELLSILDAHGALEEMRRLEERHTKSVTSLENVKTMIERTQQLEKQSTALKLKTSHLLLKAQSDFQERGSIRDRAVSLFNRFSEALYESPGKLIIELDAKGRGFLFDVEIERKASEGIKQMKVMCYDLMLACLWADKDPNPGFLIHDSSIFDGVDERQIANALQLAAKLSTEYGFQYVVCLNSDRVPRRDLDPEFNLDDFVRLKLTDATEDGGLFGIRF